MIGRLKRLVQKHLILAYVLAYLIIVCEFGCMAYLMYISSDKVWWLAFPCILTAWIIGVSEMIRECEEIKQDAYLAIVRRINRLD